MTAPFAEIVEAVDHAGQPGHRRTGGGILGNAVARREHAGMEAGGRLDGLAGIGIGGAETFLAEGRLP